MAEAILAGEQIEKFPRRPSAAGLALTSAVLPGLAKDLFMRHCPGDTGDGDRENEQPDNLCREVHVSDRERPPTIRISDTRI